MLAHLLPDEGADLLLLPDIWRGKGPTSQWGMVQLEKRKNPFPRPQQSPEVGKGPQSVAVGWIQHPFPPR